jgi:hypothetical protein
VGEATTFRLDKEEEASRLEEEDSGDNARINGRRRASNRSTPAAAAKPLFPLIGTRMVLDQ